MHTKILISGDEVEYYEYENDLPSTKRSSRVSKTPKNERKSERKGRRRDNIYRSKRAFQRLVRSNLSRGTPALLTLTMREVVDLRTAYRSYTKFGQRYRYAFGSDIAWIGVPEFQKRGAVHFHVLVWGLSDETIETERSTRKIASLWREGFVDIIKTDGNAKLATYLSKYMSKAMQDKRLLGARAYFSSRNVLRPMLFNTPLQVGFALQEWDINNQEVVEKKEYATLYLGRAVYKKIRLTSQDHE